MAIERTIVNIYLPALERSITGTIIGMLRFMPEIGQELQIIAADIYDFRDDFVKDFCHTLTPKDDPRREIVQGKFKEWLLRHEYNLDKYHVYRTLNLVIEGEDAINQISDLMGDIRIRNGITILGRFGFVEYDSNGEIRGVEFPASAPTNAQEAEAQIDLFWNKYKSYGGLLNKSIKYKLDQESKIERTVVIIKPNAFTTPSDPRLGDVIDTVARTGLHIVGVKVITPSNEQMAEFYAPHKGKPFFDSLVKFMSNDRSLALVYEGVNAIRHIRETALKIIRYAYSDSQLENTVHTSENQEDFEREFKALKFNENDLPKASHP